MPAFQPGALLTGILTIIAIAILRERAGKPRLKLWKLALAGIAAAYVIPLAVSALAGALRAVPGLGGRHVLTVDQVYIAAFVIILVLAFDKRPGKPPRLPLWAGLLAGIAAALLLPPLLNLATGSYQRPSLRADLNHCMQSGPEGAPLDQITNACDEPITVGLCLPGEVNPAPCAQSHVLQPGAAAHLDAQGSGPSSLPANPNGYTLVACRPPARPSRMGTTMGRGYEGVCLPPG